jgi:cyanate permease
VLHDVSGGWGLPLATLFAALALAVFTGWVATAPRYVDDEVGRPSADTAG